MRKQPGLAGVVTRIFGRVSRFALVAALFLGAAAQAQQSFVQQNGRMFDRNPMIGSGGVNFRRPASPLLSGNAYANGNVRRGMALRSFSPIQNPYSFRGGVGSASLSRFRRDSVSVADTRSPLGGLRPQVYFDPAQTVFAPRYLGLPRSPQLGTQRSSAATATTGLSNRFGANVPSFFSRLSQPLNLRLDKRFDGANPLAAQIVGITPSGTNQLNSSIFGVGRLADLGGHPLFQPENNARIDARSAFDARRGTLDIPGASGPAYTSLTSEALSQGLDLRIRRLDPAAAYGSPLLEGLSPDVIGSSDTYALGWRSIRRPEAGPQHTVKSALRAGLTEVLPGQDVFTDMQLAVSLAKSPDAPWFAELKRAAQQDPALAMELQAVAQMSAQAFVESVVNAPLRSFAGKGKSALNDALLKAEALLKSRNYYEAVSQYEIARIYDPTNPLPLIGKAYALLAGGDYRSAAQSLLAGLRRFPEFSRFQVDLKALLGGEAVDVRRADIMRQLEKHEDPALRFLLGYLEFHTGQKKSGLRHLRTAAEHSRPGEFIWRYPSLITGEGVMPPPKLAPPPVIPNAPGP